MDVGGDACGMLGVEPALPDCDEYEVGKSPRQRHALLALFPAFEGVFRAGLTLCRLRENVDFSAGSSKEDLHREV